MRSKHALVLVALLLFFASGAVADQVFDLTASGPGTSISLQLDGTLIGSGVYDITSVLSGTIDGYSVTLLPTTPPITASNPYDTSGVVNGWLIEYDNLLYLNAPYVDYYGLGFNVATGGAGTLANLYYSGGYLYAELGDNPPSQEYVDVTLVPEPGTLALLCVGLLALGALVTRRQVF